jgi:hypothetical protein
MSKLRLQIVDYLRRYPQSSTRYVADQFGVSTATVYAARRQAASDVVAIETPEVVEQPANARQVAGTHYKDMGVQPWEVVDTWPIDQRIGYYRGGALKYLMRMGSKDESPTEIAKGQHYMQKLLEVLCEAR